MHRKDILVPPNGWIDIPQRIKPPTAQQQGLVFKIVGITARWFGRSEVPDVFKLLSMNSRLFWGWLYFASRLFPYGKLPPRERELIILRVAWLCRCRYEWAQHIEEGFKNGLSAEDVVGVSNGASSFHNEKEGALMSACDELIGHQFISENTWQILSTHYTEKLLIEISMLIGHYQMLAGLLNSAGLHVEPSTEKTMHTFNKLLNER